MNSTQILQGLCRQLAATKRAENCVKAKRIALEEQIAPLVETPPKGQETLALPDGSKVTVKRGQRYKADLPAIKEVFKDATLKEQGLTAPIKTKEEFVVKGYEWYKTYHPEVFAKLAKHVEVKPAGTSVTVALPSEEQDGKSDETP